MCNTTRGKAFIVVGVSDDAQDFRSVANEKLVDDNLQRLCVDAITPPPRVRLRRVVWKNPDREHRDVEFAIIEIGPNVRAAYAFKTDFIDYSKKLCFRRHEVWLRRGATSDLATPAEVARLVQGKNFKDEQDDETAVARTEFGRASLADRLWIVDATCEAVLLGQGFQRMDAEKLPFPFGGYPGYSKRAGRIGWVVMNLRTRPTATLANLRDVESFSPVAQTRCLDRTAFGEDGRYVVSARTISLLPVLKSVSLEQIQNRFQYARRIGPQHFYWREDARKHWGGDKPLPTTREMVILDGISSIRELEAQLQADLDALQSVDPASLFNRYRPSVHAP